MSKKFKLKKPKRYFYEVVRQSLTTDELGTYVTYGIRVSTERTQITFVSDISTDEHAVKHLAERCTREQLDPIHLNDVIEDFLQEIPIT